MVSYEFSMPKDDDGDLVLIKAEIPELFQEVFELNDGILSFDPESITVTQLGT